MEKVLAPLVLIHLRALEDFTDSAVDQQIAQIFISYSNLALSTNNHDHD
jgi:hypothetical protein